MADVNTGGMSVVALIGLVVAVVLGYPLLLNLLANQAMVWVLLIIAGLYVLSKVVK